VVHIIVLHYFQKYLLEQKNMYIYLFLLIGSFVDFKVTLLQKNGNMWHDLVGAGDMTYSYVTWLIHMCDTHTHTELLCRSLEQQSPICVGLYCERDLIRSILLQSFISLLYNSSATAEILKRALFFGSHLRKSPICVCPCKRVFIQVSPLQCFRHSRNPEKSPIFLALICEKALFVYVPAKETSSDHFYWSL